MKRRNARAVLYGRSNRLRDALAAAVAENVAAPPRPARARPAAGESGEAPAAPAVPIRRLQEAGG